MDVLQNPIITIIHILFVGLRCIDCCQSSLKYANLNKLPAHTIYDFVENQVKD